MPDTQNVLRSRNAVLSSEHGICCPRKNGGVIDQAECEEDMAKEFN